MAGFLDEIAGVAARVETFRAAYTRTPPRRSLSLPSPFAAPAAEDDEDEWRRRRAPGSQGQPHTPPVSKRWAATPSAPEAASPSQTADLRPIINKAILATGAQPALFKIISGASGARRVGALLNYLGTREDERTGRKHDIPIVTERGEVLRDGEDRDALLDDWQSRFSTHAKGKDVGRFVIEHTGSDLAPSRIAEMLQEAFEGRRLAFAMESTDEGANTLQVVVALSARGHKLPLSPKALGQVETTLATRLAEDGHEVSRFALVQTGHAVEGVRYQLGLLAEGTWGPGFDASGHRLTPAQVNAQTRVWGREIGSYSPRDVTHALFSAREGTDPDAFFAAVQAVMDREFAGHRWVAAQHHDKGHVHVHVAMVHKSEGGERLRLSKADLARTREAIAEAAREQGISMVATRRIDLAASRPFTAAHAELVERGVAGEATVRRVEAKRSRAFAPESHPALQEPYAQVVDEWATANHVLRISQQIEAAAVAAGWIDRFAQHGILAPGMARPERFELMGELMRFASAPHEFEKGAQGNSYAVIDTGQGEKTVWSPDLARAVTEAGARPGDRVRLRSIGRDAVIPSQKDPDRAVTVVHQAPAGQRTWEVHILERWTARDGAKEVGAATSPSAPSQPSPDVANEPKQGRSWGRARDDDMEPGL